MWVEELVRLRTEVYSKGSTSNARPGGFDIQLSKLYPKLKFIIQDRGPVLKQSEQTVWPRENPTALAEGRVQFMEHNFFDQNPIKNAEVYWLRYIL
jgi:hypothetical protein